MYESAGAGAKLMRPLRWLCLFSWKDSKKLEESMCVVRGVSCVVVSCSVECHVNYIGGQRLFIHNVV